MPISVMRKILIYGHYFERKRFLRELQYIGIVELARDPDEYNPVSNGEKRRAEEDYKLLEEIKKVKDYIIPLLPEKKFI